MGGGGVYVYCSGFFIHVFKICTCAVHISVYVSALVPSPLCLGVPPLWGQRRTVNNQFCMPSEASEINFCFLGLSLLTR
jgi:hypothetical protein